MNEGANKFLVVCAGARVNAACFQAMRDLDESRECNSFQFVMCEWLNQDQLRQAAVLWIVDDSAPWQLVHFALLNSIPLLVADDSVALKELCLSASCGLFYRNSAEAEVCLEFLLNNRAVLNRMGANAKAHVIHERG